MRVKSAHFYWVTREAGSFEWFKGVMNEVAEMDHKVKFPNITNIDSQIMSVNFITLMFKTKTGFDRDAQLPY